MADTLEITGKNTISFASGQRWQLYGQARPRGMSHPFSREEVEREIRKLPLEIRSHALQMGLSKITFPFNIEGSNGADMEDALHDLIETLEDGALHIATRGARGTKAQIKYKKDGAFADSYKTVFYGEYDEAGARDVLGREQMGHKLIGAGLTLWCEPTWHPSSTTNLVNAQTVYNHDDADSGHDNFVDIAAANIKGDVPSKVRLIIDGTNSDGLKWAIVARRSQGTPSNFDHWWEAEDATNQNNWADAVDTTRSGGNIVSDSTNTSGFIAYTETANMDDFRGHLRLYASFWTDDIVNTQLRAKISIGVVGQFYEGKWKKIGKASTWQLVHLANLDLGSEVYPSGQSLSAIRVQIDYQKDAADTIKCDYVMLVPDERATMQLEGMGTNIDGVGSNTDMMFNDTADFIFVGVRDNAADFAAMVALLGNPPKLEPNTDNRLFFKWLCAASAGDPWDDHEDLIDNAGASPTQAAVTIDYLPLYISPLE